MTCFVAIFAIIILVVAVVAYCAQMIRATFDSRRRIRRFAQDDLHKNGDDLRTQLLVLGPL